jgi:hypothetical protein
MAARVRRTASPEKSELEKLRCRRRARLTRDYIIISAAGTKMPEQRVGSEQDRAALMQFL